MDAPPDPPSLPALPTAVSGRGRDTQRRTVSSSRDSSLLFTLTSSFCSPPLANCLLQALPKTDAARRGGGEKRREANKKKQLFTLTQGRGYEFWAPRMENVVGGGGVSQNCSWFSPLHVTPALKTEKKGRKADFF